MKKSILIGALCALMLFAFTACEPAVPEIPHDVTVLGGYIKAGSLYYLSGDDFDSSRYTVEVLFSDKTTKEISGSGLLSVEGNVVDGTEDVTFSYAGFTGKVGKVFVAPIDSITATTTKTEYAESATEADKSTITVTATYGDNQTAVLEAGDFEATLTKDAEAMTGVITVTASGKTAKINVKLVEQEVSDEPYPIELSKATKLEATWVGGTLYTDTAATEVAKTSNWKVVAKDDGNGSLTLSQFTITTAENMDKADTYAVQISRAGAADGKTIYFMSEVTVLDTIGGIANMNGGNFVIKVTADQDYTITDADIAAFEAQIYAVSNNVEIKGTGFHIVPDSLSRTFFPRGSFDSSGYEITYNFTWDGNNNSKEYTNTVKVFFQEGV